MAHLRDLAIDPDRHSAAMIGAEIDTFTARLARISDQGLGQTDSEMWADKLLTRDRQSGDWFTCLECRHLAGHAAGAWRCGNWRRAEVAHHARDAQLPTDFVLKFQHCPGFQAAQVANP